MSSVFSLVLEFLSVQLWLKVLSKTIFQLFSVNPIIYFPQLNNVQYEINFDSTRQINLHVVDEEDVYILNTQNAVCKKFG